MKIHKFKNDLPAEFLEGARSVAVDTETMGLMSYRDRLCLAQFCGGNEDCYLVQFDTFDKAQNIKAILSDQAILKIFHFARFDMAAFYTNLGAMTKNVYCTKIASKLVRTYAPRHGLADLCQELLGFELSKEQTCTDWGAPSLSQKQLEYAASDVLHLHKLKEKLDVMLAREGRESMAQKCFDFLETRVLFDLMVDRTYDIFAHN